MKHMQMRTKSVSTVYTFMSTDSDTLTQPFLLCLQGSGEGSMRTWRETLMGPTNSLFHILDSCVK